MSRNVLPVDRVDESIRNQVQSDYLNTVQEVIQTVESEPVVVVGMKHNPHVIRARKALTKAGVAFTYLEYGSYTAEWRRRTAIKMWSGWHTFPQVFVRGVLVGGATETIQLLESGELVARVQNDA